MTMVKEKEISPSDNGRGKGGQSHLQGKRRTVQEDGSEREKESSPSDNGKGRGEQSKREEEDLILWRAPSPLGWKRVTVGRR